jgi:hypothetical protein
MVARIHTKTHMHQTTVRFGRDLWLVLEREAERLGVSAAQYVRDATLARLAYSAAQQEEAVASREAFEWAGNAPLSERVQAQIDSAAAVLAQAQLARDRAEQLRAEAEELVRRSKARKS